jgi:glycosyltransferase involved in cell wall biosynthesis
MAKQNKHILFIPRWYPSDTDPMLGLFILNHAKAAVSAGYIVSVAYPSPSNGNLKTGIRIKIISEGGLTEVFGYYPVNSPIKSVLQILAWCKTINQAIRLNGPPSLVHAHILTRAGIIAYLVSLIYNIPYVITEHWSRYYEENKSFNGMLREQLTRFVIKHASSITVVSKRLYNAMRSNGLNFSINILPNVVNTKLFDIGNDRNLKFSFISITCFEEKSKNLRMLIDAAKMHRDAGHDFELILVGDGADRKSTETYCSLMGFNAVFTGTLTPFQTAALLKNAHCLVLSSNYETFGIVVMKLFQPVCR